MLENTVKPLNKGRFGDNINSAVVSFVRREVVLFSEVQNLLKLKGNQLFGTLKGVLCKKV